MKPKINYLFTFMIALVWIMSGLLFKILLITPRHQLIVSEILGSQYGEIFTLAIGVSEVTLGIWILLGFYQKWTALFQIVLIATMNVFEFILASELLLWGRWNIFFAGMFILFIYRFQFSPYLKISSKVDSNV